MVDARKINRTISKYKKDIVAFARDLIRIPSFSGKEGMLAKRIEKELKKSGFGGVRIDKMGNVLGFVGKGRKKIMLDAHMDTVGIANEKDWKINPFGGVLKNGNIYGRGATDQKLSMASLIYAGKAIKELNLWNDFTFIVVGSCQEEDCEGVSLMHIIEREKIKPDYVILTEPTNLSICRGHRGRVEIKVSVKGKSCHASVPEKGANAIEKICDIVREVSDLNGKLKKDRFLGKGTIAVTFLECRTPSFNAICPTASIYIDRRLSAGETLKVSVDEVKKLPSVKKYKAKVEVCKYRALSWKGFEISQEKYFPAWSIPKNHKLIRAAVKAARFALGKAPSVGRWDFSTNGVFTCGRLKIPTMGFGPSSEVYAHTVDENMPVNHLLKAAAFYASIGMFL